MVTTALTQLRLPMLLPTLLLLLTLLIPSTSSLPSPSPSPTSPLLSILTPTPLGNVTGFTHSDSNGDTRQWWNLPFALPPVGPLRWAPPHPLTRFPREPYDGSNTTNRPCGLQGSEDCLYLTVSAPSDTTAKPAGGFPVYVYIYGGAFTGSNILDASGLVAYSQAFVYVSINYRLGLLGFFPQRDLTAENAAHGFASSGNQGIQDQTAALRWVHDYISYFDGDPQRVTVGGESAGSASTCMQLLSPAAAGLFHGAVLESGGCFHPISLGGTLQQRELDVGDPITLNSGCGSQPPGAQRLACLRKLSFADVNRLQDSLPPKPGVWGINYTPISDGVTIPDAAETLLAKGRFNKVPLLIGTNRGETAMYLYPNGQQYGYHYTREDVNQQIFWYSNNNYKQLQDYYADPVHGYSLAANVDRAYIESSTNCIFLCPTRTVARAAAREGQAVYLWLSDYLDDGFWRWLNVTVHTQEMAHVYRMEWTGPVDDALILSAQMQNQWIRFIVTGSPNTAIAADSRYAKFYNSTEPLPNWPLYSVGNNQTLNIRNEAPHFQVVANIDGGQCDMWDAAIMPN